MVHCVFCQIIAGGRTADVVYKDENITAFRDIHPVAPTHILVVPNKHINSVNEVVEENELPLGRLFTVAKKIAVKEGIEQEGYRLIVNTGPFGGQSVDHIHMHLIGGRPMKYPIG